MSRASISIDRTGMPDDPDPIVIADDGEVYRLTEEGVGSVVQSVRLTTMPDSPYFDGTEIIAFSRETTALPLEFHILGTPSEIATALADLEEALYRLAYPVTRTVDGVANTYQCGPALPKPSNANVDSAVSGSGLETFGVTIPIPWPTPTA